jgi:hypothetical protein
MGWTFYNSNGEALVQHAESEATQAEMEAETAGVKFVPPDLIKHSPGVAKGWCQITAAGVLSSPDYNVASVTDTGTGDRTIVWDTDFSTNIYAVVGVITQDPAIDRHGIAFFSIAVGSVQHTVRAGNIAASLGLVDKQTASAAFGDQ